MARTKSGGNGRVDRLEESMTALGQAHTALAQAQAGLLQAQANLVARTAENDARLAEMDRRIEERFARIETILLEHSRILRALPDAVRDKIGFKAPPPQTAE